MNDDFLHDYEQRLASLSEAELRDCLREIIVAAKYAGDGSEDVESALRGWGLLPADDE